jgi:hypothetical protein
MEEENATLLKNINYTIQADITKDIFKRGDEFFKDDLFKYGYYGKFNQRAIRTFEYGYDTIANYNGYLQNNFIYSLDTIYSTGINPLLEVYNKRFYENFNGWGRHTIDGTPTIADLLEGGGYQNGHSPQSINILGLNAGDEIAMPGTNSNLYQILNTFQFHATGNISVDILGHEISAGFEYEKRTDRGYAVEPIALWVRARGLANDHIAQLDFKNPQPQFLDGVTDPYGNKIFTDTIIYPRLRSGASQSNFDLNFREAIGKGYLNTDWLNIDGYDPSDLKIDYFSPDELFVNGSSLINYWGYDHTGKELKSKASFNDFFTQYYNNKNNVKVYERLIPPFEPIYMAGYIQDKFAFNDLVFNIGLRVDYYDFNQKVLKDPYLFFEAHKTGENFPISEYSWMYDDNEKLMIPRNIPEGSTIYVNSVDDPREITGFRNGRTWYNAEGNLISGPEASTEVAPFLVGSSEVGSKEFLNAFTDYKPEIVPMPRIAFSFPISDEALFYAHYDILTKRPGVGQISYIDYLFIRERRGRLISNPNTRPEKTIAYELGFQQKLSETSSIKLSAFYREMRDMIQIQSFAGAYPVTYLTYGNLDFGTVKGATITFDLRRTGNVTLRASYTLQFAKGTGSDFQTAFTLIRAGYPNLRSIYPLDFDSRHQIGIVGDYRFAEGRNYNGPKLFGKDIFANAGLNVTVAANSGNPYTKRELGTNYVIGQINGNIMPWTTTVDAKIDKDFNIKIGEKDGKAKYSVLNIYFDVSNLFDMLNINFIYPTTGNPDDNGWLTFNQNQGTINSMPDPKAYREIYAMYANRPGHYRLPRTMRIGVIFSF